MHAHLPLCPAPWKRPCHAWWQQHHPSQFQQHGLFPVTMLLAPLALQGAHLLTLVVHLRLRVAQQWTCAACAALEWVLSPKPIVPQLHFVAPSLETATAAAPAPFAAAVVHAAAAVAPGLHAAAAAAAVVAQTAAAAAVAHAVAVFALVAPVAAAAAAAVHVAAAVVPVVHAAAAVLLAAAAAAAAAAAVAHAGGGGGGAAAVPVVQAAAAIWPDGAGIKPCICPEVGSAKTPPEQSASRSRQKDTQDAKHTRNGKIPDGLYKVSVSMQGKLVIDRQALRVVGYNSSSSLNLQIEGKFPTEQSETSGPADFCCVPCDSELFNGPQSAASC
eukprot:119163-Pelagomonas_calceolata.AAC.3